MIMLSRFYIHTWMALVLVIIMQYLFYTREVVPAFELASKRRLLVHWRDEKTKPARMD